MKQWLVCRELPEAHDCSVHFKGDECFAVEEQLLEAEVPDRKSVV